MKATKSVGEQIETPASNDSEEDDSEEDESEEYEFDACGDGGAGSSAEHAAMRTVVERGARADLAANLEV